MLLPRPRLTIRGLATIILACGLAFHFSLSAWRVHVGNEPHSHYFPGQIVHKDKILPCTYGYSIRTRFWARYYRCLLGIPWRGQCFDDSWMDVYASHHNSGNNESKRATP